MTEWISVVIPFAGEERAEYLALTLDSLRVQLDGRDEIIVVEQEYDPRYVKGRAIAKNRGARHERLTRPGRFNRSACINRGVDTANNKLVLVSDCDCLKGPKYLEYLRGSITPGVGLWGMVCRLGKLPSLEVLRDGGVRDFEAAWELSVPEKAGWGDSAAFFRCDWKKAGQYCEEFEGWGAEDDEFVDRLAGQVEAVGRDPKMRSLHLWHPAPAKKAEDAACNAKLLREKRVGRASLGQ